MKNRIITISRQFGSGGRVIGEEVAKKLGINNIDFYVELSKAFLSDKDAGPGKLMKCYEYVVK